MPSLDELLAETMMFTASPGLKGRHLGRDAAISAPEPSPTVTKDKNVILQNPVWAWDHDPDSPATVKNVRSKVRGMGMNYAHAMPVATSISIDQLDLKVAGLDSITLPLTKPFVLRKYKLDAGRIPASSSGLWQLESEVDQSLMIVFGYDIQTNTPRPLTEAEVQKLGADFMPARGQKAPPVEITVGEELKVWVAPLRLIVAFSLTCCKERSDYTPGPKLVGMNRLYPHVMAIASQPLDMLRATISVERPANTMHAGPMAPNPGTGERDEMHAALRPILFTDSNQATVPAPFSLPPIWSNIFDYYSTDPIKQGITGFTMVDPTKTRSREGTGAIEKLNPKGYRAEKVLKVPRQGEFDNLHIAPPMRAPSRIAKAAGWQLDDITMAPLCFHDCFHFHTRWGLEFKDKQVCGFDDKGNPYAVPGAPMVPHDQKVVVSLLAPAGFAYEGIIDPPTGKIAASTWQVFFHHGLGYANDVWDETLFTTAMAGLELFSMGEKKWMPTSAANSVALFYWRLRFGGLNSAQERIRFTHANALLNLRKL